MFDQSPGVNVRAELHLLALAVLARRDAPSTPRTGEIQNLVDPKSASADVNDARMNDPVNSVSSPLSTASVLNPMIEFRGVRSSCVMLKKNARWRFVMCTANAVRRSSATSMNRNAPAEITRLYVNFVSTSLYRYRSCCSLQLRYPHSVAK